MTGGIGGSGASGLGIDAVLQKIFDQYRSDGRPGHGTDGSGGRRAGASSAGDCTFRRPDQPMEEERLRVILAPAFLCDQVARGGIGDLTESPYWTAWSIAYGTPAGDIGVGRNCII